MEIFAHRGAVNFAAENTIESVKKALDLKVYGIELDIHETKDHHLIVFHDYILNIKTKSKGRIAKKTLDEIRKVELKSGSKIPTLEEILDIIAGKCVLNLEIKSWKAVDRVVEMVEKYKIVDRVMISSYYKNTMKRVKEKNSGIETAIIMGSHFLPKDFVKVLKRYHANALHLPQHRITKAIVDDLHKAGLKVRSFPYMNCGTSKEVFEKLKGYGIDGVIANNPEELS